MEILKLRPSKSFMTKDANFHLIDTAGNHFINGKCVNPKCAHGGDIGDTYPDESEIINTNV